MSAPGFTLAVELGNDAMRTPDDVARALRKVADRLADVHGLDQATILDDNGNAVGWWSFAPA